MGVEGEHCAGHVAGKARPARSLERDEEEVPRDGDQKSHERIAPCHLGPVQEVRVEGDEEGCDHARCLPEQSGANRVHGRHRERGGYDGQAAHRRHV